MPGMSCLVDPTGTVVDDHLQPSSKLVAHTSKPLTIGSKMHETPFSSLSLRLNRPYWLVHHGNCEHFLVVDQIRYVVSHSTFRLVNFLFVCLVYCIHRILPLGTRLPRISHPHYLGTVVRVRKFRWYIQLSVICALVRARAYYAHLAGGTWVCQKTQRLNLLWLSHSPSMNSGISIHHTVLHYCFLARSSRSINRVSVTSHAETGQQKDGS